MRARSNNYTDEFRSDAVALYRRGSRSLRQIANDLGVNSWTLRDWVRKEEAMKRSKKKQMHVATVTPPPDETPEEKVKRLERQLTRLEKENEQLRMDREILKKAAAFFAKESE